MPITNTQGSFSIGRDCTLVMIHASLGRFDLPNVTGFQAQQQTTQVKVDRLDGVQLNAHLPKGWTGSFDLERGSSGVDDFFAQIESLWLDGGAYGTATIYQYVTEPDGSQSTYQFDNCALKFDDTGAWKGDSSVKQKISFEANRRRSM